MTPTKIAIIGYGKIAADQHLPSIQGNPDFDLVATSSRTGQGVERSFLDWRKLLRDTPGLQAVAITTPPGPRYEIARECILAGLHCLLEKPPSAGLAEIADLETLAIAKGVTLFTTWHAQHHSTVDAAAKALAGKRIKSLEILWHEDVHKWHRGQQWIWDPGGFGVFDPGINALSIATKIFPGGLFVESAKLDVPSNAQNPIAADIVFSSPQADGPLHANFDWRRSEGEEWTIAVEASDGTTVRLEGGGQTLILNGQWQEEAALGEYPDIYRVFADLIAAHTSLVDVAPFRLVADSLLVAIRSNVEPITMRYKPGPAGESQSSVGQASFDQNWEGCVSQVIADGLTRADEAFAGNRLLATMAKEARRLTEPLGEMVQLAPGDIVIHRGEDVESSFFPIGPTMISMTVELAGGRSVEVASIGREGAVGGIVSCGHAPAFARAQVLVPGRAFRIPLELLQKAKADSPFIANLFCRFSDYLLAQVMQSAACNAYHTIPERAARWLLHAQDRAGDRIELTQEAFAGLLGVQRTTVNAVVRELADERLISTGRGNIHVVDRAGLKRRSCECYDRLEEHFGAVIGISGHGPG